MFHRTAASAGTRLPVGHRPAVTLSDGAADKDCCARCELRERYKLQVRATVTAVTAPPCRHCVSNSARRFFGAGGVSSPGAADDEQWEDASSSSAGGLAEGETALISRTPVHLAAGGE